MKLAYWPGCVSRGFTPELHGSMAQVAPKLDLELVELDRANCCGAGVIAEHNQELVDTLNARTFAMAQEVDGRGGHDEHLLHLPGRAVGVPGAPRRRLRATASTSTTHLEPEGLAYERDGEWWNKNFLWLLVEEIGLDTLREKVVRPLEGLRVAPFYGCYIVRPTERLGLRRAPRARPLPRQRDRGARRRAGRVRRRHKCCGFPVITMNRDDLAAPGGPPHGRRDRRRRRLRGHPVPALPPEPRHAAARGREVRRARPRHAGPAPAPAGRAWPSASSPRSWG